MLPVKGWKPEAMVRFFGLLLVGLFAASLVLGALQGEGGQLPSWMIQMVGTVVLQGIVLVLVHFFLREHGQSWSYAFGFSAQPGWSGWVGVWTGIGVLPVALFLSFISHQVMQWLGLEPQMQEPVQLLLESEEAWRKYFIGAVAIILAPVVEEIIFRGILYPALKERGYPRLALWGTSVAFAAMHFNWMTLPALLFLAVVLVVLYEKTENLLAPIAAHAVFNGANYLLLMAAEHSELAGVWMNLG